MIKIGLIGYGYWGPNLVRNFVATENCQVKTVADSRLDRLSIVSKMYPGISVTDKATDIIQDPEIDAVIIATPVFSHFGIAMSALENGKHVLIEKPMTSSVQEAEQLLEVAEKKGLVVMVDHTFLYTGAVNKMKQLINDDIIGELKYFDSTRINLGLFQPDVNVLWDLAPHDLSILFHLVDEKPVSVNATGVSHTNNGIENIAYLTVNYGNNFIAHINCSWTSPMKVRSTLIGGDKKMIFYNDLEPSEKIRVYDTGFSYKTDEEKNRILVDYRVGDVQIPKISPSEALAGVAKDFIQSIQSKGTPVANGIIGLTVVKVLEAAQESIKQDGKEVKIKI
ncbi:MAG: Gfo/Idh/MocA family oxidoreductase [Chitinophagaceae bacterium]|nr:Gfo/Idh/MocA family oxidoreductase [Chitinophagaceae bacterium]MCA6464537.1 Gfo/Idh/MocA family oxidoreductase [Chitinophagaceae bacterium]